MPDWSEYGEVTEYSYGLGPDQPPTGVVTKEEFLKKLVYNLTPDEASKPKFVVDLKLLCFRFFEMVILIWFGQLIQEYRLATMLLRPAPLRAFQGTQLQFTDEGENAESVPRVFIKTLLDKVIKPEQQDAMVNRWPPSLFFALKSDHSPLLSAPTELCNLLLQSAASLSDH